MTDSQQWVAMGYVKNVFGVKGWLKVAANTGYSDSLLDFPVWRLRKDDHIQTVSLEAGKTINGELQVKFIGIDDRDTAFALRGYTIEILRDQFAPTDEDEYYWTDLVRMSVVNLHGQLLGQVVNLMETGAHDILMVQGEYGEKLIPFVAHYINNVDNNSKTITVDWELDY